MSIRAALPLPVSVGRPGRPKPAVSRAAPQGRAQRPLTLPAMIFDPTDGGRELHRRRAGHAVFYSQITSPNTRRFTQPLTGSLGQLHFYKGLRLIWSPNGPKIARLAITTVAPQRLGHAFDSLQGVARVEVGVRSQMMAHTTEQMTARGLHDLGWLKISKSSRPSKPSSGPPKI